MPFYKNNSLRSAGLLFFLFFAGLPMAFAQESLIQRIQYALPCIVEITAKNAVMFKIPGSAFIDPDTGQLIQLDSIRAAEYTREGSGVVIDPAGVIVTNAHTVNNSARTEVRLIDGQQVPAQTLKVIAEQDLAFLKIEPPCPLSRVDIVDSGTVQLDSEVVTVGSSPFLQKTISGGRVIGYAKHGNFYENSAPDLFEININIYQGDSGGPLFNSKGQLIGLMVAKQGDQDRRCFAIPSDKIIRAYLDLIEEIKQKGSL